MSAIKGKGSLADGIEFLRSYDIVVHPRCQHLIDELTYYSWKIDRQTGEILPEPADKHNHVIDALRYALEAARKARSSGFEFASAGRRVTADLLDEYIPGSQGYGAKDRDLWD